MNTYPNLYELAQRLDSEWEAREAVDWQQAEDLVAEVRKMSPDDCGELQAIVDYADEEDEWDSEVVAGWPEAIESYLDTGDKHYTYRSDGENWEVFGVHMSGNEDWSGTVCTETMAEGFVALLSGSLVQLNLSK